MSETDFQRSAGGVLFRKTRGGIIVCLIQPRGRRRWQLPKGHIEEGETEAEAALREVEEETGYRGSIVQPLHSIRYDFWWTEEGTRIHIEKEVVFFLMEHEGGDPIAADEEEVREVRWFGLNEVFRYIAFEGERSVLDAAREHIEDVLGKESDV